MGQCRQRKQDKRLLSDSHVEKLLSTQETNISIFSKEVMTLFLTNLLPLSLS